MKRRVLIVTSSYAPTMIADMHRARHLAWELPKIGWQVEILSPDNSYQQPSCLDEDSAGFFPPDTITHFVRQYCSRLFRVLGFGSIGWRALLPMLLAGGRLLRGRGFDLVYFSTTQFPLFLLGPVWLRWLGVSFVLDIHDPCYKEDSVTPVWARPSLKYTLSRWLAKHIESLSVPAAAGVVAVSPDYIRTLRGRYENDRPQWLGGGRQAVIPFAVLPQDFDEVAKKTIAITDPAAEQPARIVYVGAGGPIMLRAFRLLCRALAYLREHDPRLIDRVKIELYGTMLGWQEGDPGILRTLREHGIADLVREDPHRVSYRRSVELLLEGDGVLVLGVDDAGYMPSKLFSYALSGRPVLAAIRRDSPAFAQFQSTPGLGHAIWFDQSGEMLMAAVAEEVGNFLREAAARIKFDRKTMLKSFMAPFMARRHAELFEACLQPNVSTSVR